MARFELVATRERLRRLPRFNSSIVRFERTPITICQRATYVSIPQCYDSNKSVHSETVNRGSFQFLYGSIQTFCPFQTVHVIPFRLPHGRIQTR